MSAKLLDVFESRLRLEGVLVTRTALHIGAGGSGDALGTDSPVVRTAAGLPYIPGSSLKGVIRSAAEALLRGGSFQATKQRFWACDVISGKPCVCHDRVKSLREEIAQQAGREEREPGRRELAEAVWAESCGVCRLFGSLALASRVRFADLPLRGELPLSELRNGVGIDRDKELAASGVLYDFEAVPPEIPFELRVTIDNPTDEEVGLLLYLFEELDAGHLTLGGKTSRGLGRIGVQWEKIEEITLKQSNPFADLLSSRDLLARSEPVPSQDSGDPLAQKLPATGDHEVWRSLAEILLGLPRIDKDLLAQQAAPLGLNKDNLSQKLGLGLAGKRTQKTWNVVLDRLTGSGFLIKEGEGYRVAGGDPERGATDQKSARSFALQEVYDRFIKAMALVWQEAS